MGTRVGFDLVDVADVDAACDRWGERYLARVYTRGEIDACSALPPSGRLRRLAACFAAKEATLKVLEPGDDEIPWQHIELCHRPNGDLTLRLTDTAQAFAERRGITELSVSVTWTDGVAAAVVLAGTGERSHRGE